VSNGKKTGWAFVAVLALSLAGMIGYVAGSDTSGAVHCDAGRVVVSVNVSGADERGNGTRTVEIGHCNRLSDDAFVAVVDALVGAAPTTTTAKSATATTTTAAKTP
jgi:hypothetical protein